MPVGLFAAILIVLLAGALVTGGVTASAKALPGDLLYPIKITGERVQLFMARDPVTRSVLEQEFSGRRRQEAKAVVEQGRRVNSLPLDGTLEAINDNHWTVSGLYLTLDPAAQIIGMPTVGARVHGVLRAPGDGRLIVIYAVVDAPCRGRSARACRDAANRNLHSTPDDRDCDCNSNSHRHARRHCDQHGRRAQSAHPGQARA